MFVDDVGYRRGLPNNTEATALYHKVCKTGIITPMPAIPKFAINPLQLTGPAALSILRRRIPCCSRGPRHRTRPAHACKLLAPAKRAPLSLGVVGCRSGFATCATHGVPPQ
jgi:hypothetical protein